MKKKKITLKKGLAFCRVLVQIGFLIFAPSLYAAAFTGVKQCFIALGSGQPLAWSSFTEQLLILLVLTAAAGRIFCGWACAFGAVGDWIYLVSQWIQKKLKRKLPKISEKWVKRLQWVKYLVLILILTLCFCGNSGLVSSNSPWTAFSLLLAGRWNFDGMEIALALLILLIPGMAVQERFFCQFLCPMGAIFSMMPVLPFMDLHRNSENCPPRCGACQKNCPTGLLLGSDPLKEGECIRCGRCAAICPRKNITGPIGRLKKKIAKRW